MLDSSAYVLTVNVGSSSLKLRVRAAGDSQDRKGAFEKIGSDACEWHLENADGEGIAGSGSIASAAEAVPIIKEWLGEATPAVIAHRFVHGGPSLTRHCVMDGEVVEKLRHAASLAPEHLPAELEMVEALRGLYPDVTQVACLDTAFHASLPEEARTYALPKRLRDAGVRRYGFHGLSYEYLVGWLKERDLAKGRSVLAHLGNGASMAAVLDGASVDTTMGLTPAGGLVMGSRSGDLDPGIFRFLAQELGMTAEEVDRQMNHESGLRGLAEGSADVRDLLATRETDACAALALRVFVRSAKKHLSALAAVLGGLDRVVFTGGIGEHSHEIRAEILTGLEFLGIHVNPAANAEGRMLISTPDSAVTVHVVPANEEAAMFRIATALIQLSNPSEKS